VFAEKEDPRAGTIQIKFGSKESRMLAFPAVLCHYLAAAKGGGSKAQAKSLGSVRSVRVAELPYTEKRMFQV
jgi:hypothetical protein